MPKRNVNRKQRVSDLIQNSLAEIIHSEAKDSRFGMITITGVDVAPDLTYAKVYVSVLDEAKAKETVAALNNAAKYFRYSLAQAVDLRITPQLKFVYDDSIVRGNRINSLINDALKDDKEE